MYRLLEQHLHWIASGRLVMTVWHAREGGEIRVFIALVPKVLSCFIIRFLTTFGILNEF